MLHIADTKVGSFKDAFKVILPALLEDGTVQIHFGEKSFFAMNNKGVLAQVFFEAFTKIDDCEVLVNVKELKDVLTAFRTKNQVLSVTHDEGKLIFTSKTKTAEIPNVDFKERKTKLNKTIKIGEMDPADLKCLLKPTHPAKSLTLDDNGFNGDLALSNKDGQLQISFYSYTNEILLNYSFDEKNQYLDFKCFVDGSKLDLLKKLTNNSIAALTLSVAGKYLKIESGSLAVYLPAVKMQKAIRVDQYDTSDWLCIESDEAEKDNLKVAKKELDPADLYQGVFKRHSVGYRDKITKYISWIIPSSSQMYMRQLDQVYIVVFKRLKGNITLIA